MVEKRLSDCAEIASLVALAGEIFSLSGVENPQIEAEVLMAEALGTSRAGVFTRLREEPGQAIRGRFTGLVERRAAREPLQYILGRQEFSGRIFRVNPTVLVPRPETEMLAREGAGFLKGLGPSLAADIGTGSGCIAVTLALEAPGTFVYAVDSSGAALRTAAENAEQNGAAGSVRFLEGDMLRPLSGMGLEDRLDLVISNPPYIPTDDIRGLQPEVLFEPKAALDGGPDGLDAIRRLVREAPAYLKSGGRLMLEVGFGQAGAVRETIKDEPGLHFEKIILDFAGIERIISAVRD